MKGKYRGAVASSFYVIYISTEKSQQDLQLIELHMKVWPARLLTSLMLLAFKLPCSAVVVIAALAATLFSL